MAIYQPRGRAQGGHAAIGALRQAIIRRPTGIFYNDANWQQHPDKCEGLFAAAVHRIFSTESDCKGPIVSNHVDFSKRDHTGVVVASTINWLPANLTLKVQELGRDDFILPHLCWDARTMEARPLLALRQWHRDVMACSSGRIWPSAAGLASAVPTARSRRRQKRGKEAVVASFLDGLGREGLEGRAERCSVLLQSS